MADTALNIGINTSANLGGLNQTVAAINQVTAAQQRQAQVGRDAAALQQRLGGVGSAALGALGIPFTAAAFVAGLVASVRSLIAETARLKDFSEQLGVLPSEFKAIEETARDAGLPVSNFVQVISALRQARRAAAEGNEEARQTFARFGVTLANLNDPALRAVDLLQKIGQATQGLNEADLSKLRDILGPRADRVANALSGLGPSANKQTDEAISGVEKLDKAFERLVRTVKGPVMVALGGLANVLAGAGRFWRGEGDNEDRASQVQRVQFEIFRHRQWKKAELLGQQDTPQARAGRAEALANYGMTFEQYQQRPDLQPQRPALHADLAAAQAIAALDKQRLENAEKRRKLEFDLLTPAQQRADIEKRIKDQKESMGFMAEGVEKEIEQGKILDLQGQLAGLNKQGDKGAAPLSVNEWERMGANFGGGKDQAQETVQLQREANGMIRGIQYQFAAFGQIFTMGLPVKIKDE